MKSQWTEEPCLAGGDTRHPLGQNSKMGNTVHGILHIYGLRADTHKNSAE